ncbi:MAG: DEAD/DEAH box helicase, partial [Candidatus Binatia bacterium]
MYFYEVALLKIVRQDSSVLTYHSKNELARGTLVTVPVGKKTLPGVVWQRVKKPTYTTKYIEHIIYSKPLPAPLLKTAAWMSDYYGTHLATVLQTVLPAGVEKKRRDGADPGHPIITRARTSFDLNPGQQAALEIIGQAGAKTVLLHGVTGAGKTAVYIEYLKKVIAGGNSAIVLTPEISLTPQLTAELRQHFHEVVITHSKLTQAERHRLWQRLLETETPTVVVGPRSALFMPLK